MTVIEFECSHDEEETSKVWIHCTSGAVGRSVTQVECNIVSELHMSPVAASVYVIVKEIAEPLSLSVILKVV